MDSQKRYSFRKYRGVGLASVAVATLFFGLSAGAVQADSLEAPIEEVVLVVANEVANPDDFVAPADGQEETGQADDLAQPGLEQPGSSAMSPMETTEFQPIVESSDNPAELPTELPELEPAIAYAEASGERLAAVVRELQATHGADVNYDRLSIQEQTRYEEAVYHEYANHLVANVFPNVQEVTAFSQLRLRDVLTQYTQYLREEMTKRGNPKAGTPENQAAIASAQERVVQEHNRNLMTEPTVDAYIKQAPEVAKQLIKAVVAGQSLSNLEQNRANAFRGLYLLHSQYQFEADLPTKIVTQSADVTTGTVIKRSALQNLIQIGQYTATAGLRSKGDLANLLNYNKELYQAHIRPVIGTTSQSDLVKKLATQNGLAPEDYLLQQTEATLQVSDQVDKTQLVNWLGSNTELLIPLLAQGKGALVGLTRDSLLVGINAVYQTADELPHLESSHHRRQAQTPLAQVVGILNDMERFNTFLRDASRYGANQEPSSARATVVRDSLILGKIEAGRDNRIWQTKTNNDTVRLLLAPLGMDSPSYQLSSMIDGESQSEHGFVAYRIKLFGKDKQGVTLYTHEMTHSNDERLLFEGTYQGTTRMPAVLANRRQGQGPEVYARGLFEAQDNTQTPTSRVRPVFNFNTAITVTPGAGLPTVHQLQPNQGLDTVDKLATYQNKLIRLIMWLEAKEAVEALKLPEADRQIYFNQVQQVVRTGTNAHTASTNDNLVASSKAPNSLADLVEGSYVTATYLANGTTRLGLVETNGYHFVPLFDSFYGANYAPEGQNTVGDLSFKRNAHEILGWYGFDAMIDYLSGKSTSDQEFLTKLQARQMGKTSTLEGKLEADPKATKLKQYDELLKLELQGVSDAIKGIYTPEKLAQAIAADLAILKQSAGNDSAIYFNAVNVRKLKQELLSTLIETTDWMSPSHNRQVLAEKTYQVTYGFAPAPGTSQPLPTQLMALLSGKEQSSLPDGALISLPELERTDLSVTGGRWLFTGWEQSVTKVAGADVTLLGYWRFQPILASDLQAPVLTPVVNPNQLTDQEKTAVRQAVKLANATLMLSDDQILVANNGQVTISLIDQTNRVFTPEQIIQSMGSQSERYQPIGQDASVAVDTVLRPEDLVANRADLPKDARYDFLQPIDTSLAGISRVVRLQVTYSDGSSSLIRVRVRVKNTQDQEYIPMGKAVSISLGQSLQPADLIVNRADLPPATRFTWATQLNLRTPGGKLATIQVTYPDGSTEKVTVRFLVR